MPPADTPVDAELVDPDDASTALQTTSDSAIVKSQDNYRNLSEEQIGAVETALMMNNFGALTKAQRALVILKKCEQIGVSIWLQPYAWGTMDGKLVPVPLKGLFQQLRAKNNLTITKIEEEIDKELGIFMVKVHGRVTGSSGVVREDMGLGVVGIKGLTGDPLANAMMKAHTKAKNRLTGSLCGGDSGIDDTEMSSVAGAFMGEDKPAGIRQITPGSGPGQKNQSSVTLLAQPFQSQPQSVSMTANLTPPQPPPGPEPPAEQGPAYIGGTAVVPSNDFAPPPSPLPPTTAPIKVGSSAPANSPSTSPKKLIKAT